MTDVTTQYENDAFTTITNVSLGPTDLSITVASGEGATFPNVGTPQYFYATLEDAAGQVEVVKVTEHLASGDTFTVERGQDNTAAATFVSGDYFEMRPNAAVFEELRDAITTKSDITYVDSEITTAVADYLPLAGGTLTGQAKGITPLADDDLTRKDFVEEQSMTKSSQQSRAVLDAADIPSSSANSIVVSGFYEIDATITNLPTGVTVGVLTHLVLGTTHYQTVHDSATNFVYARNYVGSWKPWQGIANNATSTVAGGVTMRVSGTDLYIRNDGGTA